RGKFVLLTEPREMAPPTEADSHRLDEKELGDLQKAPEPFVAPPIHWPITSLPDDPKKREQLFASAPLAVRNELSERLRHIRDRLSAFLKEEGVAAVLSGDLRGAGGIFFAEAAGSYEVGAPIPPPRISLAPESYDRLCRLLQRRIPTKIEL